MKSKALNKSAVVDIVQGHLLAQVKEGMIGGFTDLDDKMNHCIIGQEDALKEYYYDWVDSELDILDKWLDLVESTPMRFDEFEDWLYVYGQYGFLTQAYIRGYDWYVSIRSLDNMVADIDQIVYTNLDKRLGCE